MYSVKAAFIHTRRSLMSSLYCLVLDDIEEIKEETQPEVCLSFVWLN